jgi:hypothetical protein
MLMGYRRGDDFRGRHDRYRSWLNHDDRGRGRWGGRSGLTAMTFRALVNAVGGRVSNDYASEKYCYAKRQCGGFKSVFHDEQTPWVGSA